MAKENKMTDEMKFDLRVIERKIGKGEIDSKEYEAFLKKLPNDEAHAEYIDVFEETSGEERTPYFERPTFT